MGLDITIGFLVLLAGIRGWLKGFWLQAIRLAALAGCVFLADPVRDLARPYVHDFFPTIEPKLMDRFLWWAAVVLGYLLLSGIPTSLLRLARRRPPVAESETQWGEYGAGFLLGVAKGAVVAAFLLWGLDHYAAPRYAQDDGWIGEQFTQSRILPLAREYRPAERIWASEPVQVFVHRIQTRGLGTLPNLASPLGPDAELPPPSSAQKHPSQVPAQIPQPALSLPAPTLPDPSSPDFLNELDHALMREGVRKTN